MTQAFTSRQVAQMFGLHPASVTNACVAGTIKAEKFGNTYAITRAALCDWFRNHYRPAMLTLSPEALAVLNDAKPIREISDRLCKCDAPVEGDLI